MTDNEPAVLLGYCPRCQKPVVRDPAAPYGTDGAARLWMGIGPGRVPVHIRCALGRGPAGGHYSPEEVADALKRMMGDRFPTTKREVAASERAEMLCHSMDIEIQKYPGGHKDGMWEVWIEVTTRREARQVARHLAGMIRDGNVVVVGRKVGLSMSAGGR